MVVVLQLASLLAVVASVVLAYRRISTTDFVSGGVRSSVAPLLVPIGVYLLGGVLLIADIVVMASSGALPDQLARVAGLFVVLLVAGAFIFALFFQTVKSQGRSAAAGNILGLLRSSQNDTVSSAGEKAADTLDTRATADRESSPTEQAESADSTQRGASATQTAASDSATTRQTESTGTEASTADQGSTAERSTTATDVERDGTPSTLRRFEFTLYLLSLIPVTLAAVAYVQSTEGIASAAGAAVAAGVVGVSVLIALLGVAVRKRWRVGYYGGLWACGLLGFGGLFMLFQPDALRVLGVTFLLGALGVYWGANSKPYF
ncbi:hypothetical protein [Halobacterium hubeiense]|uniref:hypothetical protein n=1 Tax=Halobacterium hubeiense TaxID=1407499 RepID=UPI003C707680